MSSTTAQPGGRRARPSLHSGSTFTAPQERYEAASRFDEDVLQQAAERYGPRQLPLGLMIHSGRDSFLLVSTICKDEIV